MILSVWGFFLWGWFLVSVSWGQRKYLIWFQFSWICWGLFCFPIMWSVFENIPCAFERMCILLLWDERLSIYHLSPFDLGHCSIPQYLFDILFGGSIHFWQWGVEIPYYNCVAVNIFLEVLQDFPYIFGCSDVWYMYIYNVYVFLMDSSLQYYEVTF